MIYTPADLSSSDFTDCNVARFAVFGKPIAHSLSPLMQNAALKKIAETNATYAKSQYNAFEVDSEILGEVLEDFYKKNFVGINLTIPHKEVVMPFLSEVDNSARLAKACNTLKKINNGWRGYNTDGFGLEMAIWHAFGRKLENADVVILGAGGAARGASFHILSKKCATLTIANRSQDRLEKLASDIRAEGFDCNTLTLSSDIKIPENAIVVNSTSIGLKDTDSAVLDFSKFPRSAVFFDMPYRKGSETTSVATARKFGIKAQSGLPMLAWQGAKSMSIWTNADCNELGTIMLKELGL